MPAGMLSGPSNLKSAAWKVRLAGAAGVAATGAAAAVVSAAAGAFSFGAHAATLNIASVTNTELPCRYMVPPRVGGWGMQEIERRAAPCQLDFPP